MADLLSYQDALRRLEASIEPLEPTRVSWRDCLGTTLAEDAFACECVPAFDNSAMDGYAVRSQDVSGASQDCPASLKVTSEIFAGCPIPQDSLQPGSAAKIMTGAPVPPGADAVVIVEKTERNGDCVNVFSPVRSGANIRMKGEEIQPNSLLIGKGARIGPVEMGLLAMQGIDEISVRKPPKIALFSSGDELVEPGGEVGSGQIRNANTYTLAGELQLRGYPVLDLGIVRDEPTAIRESVDKALSEADVLITIGGVSAGEKDYIPRILNDMGMKTVFHKLKVKPGKPLLFGILNGAYVFGLPGNVVSVLTTFHLIAAPALRLLAGRNDWNNTVTYARMARLTHNPGNRTNFMRCTLSHTPTGLPLAVPCERQGSGMLTTMQGVDGFAVIPGDLDTVEEFDVVEFIPLRLD